MLLIALPGQKTALRQPAHPATDRNPAERPVYLTIRQIFLTSGSTRPGQA